MKVSGMWVVFRFGFRRICHNSQDRRAHIRKAKPFWPWIYGGFTLCPLNLQNRCFFFLSSYISTSLSYTFHGRVIFSILRQNNKSGYLIGLPIRNGLEEVLPLAQLVSDVVVGPDNGHLKVRTRPLFRLEIKMGLREIRKRVFGLIKGAAGRAGVLAALCAATTFSPAEAQDSAVEIEEIVVTGTRRESAIHDTPMAISALTEQQIRDFGIKDIRDIDLITPGLWIGGNAGFGQQGVQIRGRRFGADGHRRRRRCRHLC